MEQAGPEEKATPRVEGKEIRRASAAGSAQCLSCWLPTLPLLRAARPPPPVADSLFWAVWQIMEGRPPSWFSGSPQLLFSPDGSAVLQRVTAWAFPLLSPLKGAVWFGMSVTSRILSSSTCEMGIMISRSQSCSDDRMIQQNLARNKYLINGDGNGDDEGLMGCRVGRREKINADI